MKFLELLSSIKRKFIYVLPESIWSEYFVAYLYFYINNRKIPNIKNPRDFNEKTLWRRFHERDINYSSYVDKYEVRKYVTQKVGKEYLVPLIGVYSNINEIEFKDLPDKFIFKTTHGSGGNVLCLNKDNFDWEKEKKKLDKFLKINYYRQTREIAYKGIKHRVVCEELLEDNIIDYKFFCYDGEPHFIEIDANRYTGHLRSFYKANWEEVKNAKMTYPNIPKRMLEKPALYDEMIRICKILSKDFKFVRVDLYYTNNKIYFGELTFFHTAGVEKIEPHSFCVELGNPLKIEK